MKNQNTAGKKRPRAAAVGSTLLCLALAATAVPTMMLADGEALADVLAEKNVTAIAEGTFSANENARWALGSNGTLAVRGSGATAADSVLYDVGDEVKHLFIGKDINSIGSESFSFFANLESVEFEKGSKLSEIGPYAFAGCRSLRHITLPSSVISVGEAAFLDCEQMMRAEFGESPSLKTIGPSAFINCKELADLDLPKTLTSIGDYAFNGCASLSKITVPSSVEAVGEEAFGDCGKLENVTIKDPSKTSVDDFAFAGQTAAKPTTVAIKNIEVGKRSVKVSWKKVKGCKTYKLFYKPQSAKSYRSKLVKNSSSKTLKGLKSKTRYQIYVLAKKDGKWACKSMVKTSKKVK